MRIQIICAAVLLAAVLASSALAVDPSLVAWYTFDEGSGTTVHDSANGHDGTINGATWAAGKVGGALSFDGVNDYIDVPDNPALRFTKSDSFTICSWVNPASTGDIVCKMQAGSQHGLFTYEMQWSATGQYFDLQFCNSGNYYKYIYTPNGSAPPGSWYHVACVYQNKNAMIYLNGELAGSGYFNSDPSGAANNSLAMGVRAYDDIKFDYLNGTLDDIRIYNRALTAEEIKAIPEPATIALFGLGIMALRGKRKS
jgi:hypothetical protein